MTPATQRRFDPDPIVAGPEERLTHPARTIAGFHIFTSDDLADTEQWQRCFALPAPTR